MQVCNNDHKHFFSYKKNLHLKSISIEEAITIILNLLLVVLCLIQVDYPI